MTKTTEICKERRRLCKFYLNGFCKKGNECRFSHNLSNSIVTLVPPGVVDVIQKTRKKGYCYCGSQLMMIPYYDKKLETVETKWFCVCRRTKKNIRRCRQ